VKLDRSLVQGIDGDPPKQALVAGMRHFARTTHRRLIAEGVETDAEAAMLAALDVRLAQGYLFGRPEALPT
jgi:EAL domain-containing protein (putative c-di-GMP-specific phosphodiesterase class I)